MYKKTRERELTGNLFLFMELILDVLYVSPYILPDKLLPGYFFPTFLSISDIISTWTFCISKSSCC